jgi:hypothetical protein
MTSGHLERINLNHQMEYLERQRGEKGLQGESLRSLRVLRKLLLKYSEDYEYDYDKSDLTSSGETKLCHVHYLDGEIEDLTLASFDRLIRSETWRLQVLLLQGYVPSISQQEGFYSDKPKVSPFLSCPSVLSPLSPVPSRPSLDIDSLQITHHWS